MLCARDRVLQDPQAQFAIITNRPRDDALFNRRQTKPLLHGHRHHSKGRLRRLLARVVGVHDDALPKASMQAGAAQCRRCVASLVGVAHEQRVCDVPRPCCKCGRRGGPWAQFRVPLMVSLRSIRGPPCPADGRLLCALRQSRLAAEPHPGCTEQAGAFRHGCTRTGALGFALSRARRSKGEMADVCVPNATCST